LGEQKKTPEAVSGDLKLVVEIVKDPIFELRGNDLIYKVSINFAESILGKHVTIPYYADENMTIDIGEFTIIKPKEEYTIPNKGMSITENTYGDMILVFDISYPKLQLTEEDKNMVKKLFDV
jgi:DnaJ homolog subfamily B member 4